MSYQAYLDAIEKKTEQDPAAAARRGGGARVHGDDQGGRVVCDWLKADYDLGRGHAMALYGVLKNGSTISATHVGSAAPPTPTRPPSCGSTASTTADQTVHQQRRSDHVHQHQRVPDLRLRPGRGARLLRRQARPRGAHRRGPRLHALAHRQRPRPPGPRDPARAARTAVDGRGHRRPGPRAGEQGRDGRLGRLRDRRLPQDLRRARGQGRGVHRRPQRAALRHRRRHPRPVRQQAEVRAAEGRRLERRVPPARRDCTGNSTPDRRIVLHCPGPCWDRRRGSTTAGSAPGNVALGWNFRLHIGGAELPTPTAPEFPRHDRQFPALSGRPAAAVGPDVLRTAARTPGPRPCRPRRRGTASRTRRRCAGGRRRAPAWSRAARRSRRPPPTAAS